MNNNNTKVSDHVVFLPFYDYLSETEKMFIERNSVIRSFNKNEIFHESNYEWLGLIYQISGSMKIFITSKEGRNINLFRIEQDETYAFSASCAFRNISFETTIRIEEPSSVLLINPSAASKLINDNIYVRCCIYEKSTQNFSSVMSAMEQILFNSIEERLSSFLITESLKRGSSEINMTHEQIADHVNSAREVIARMLKKFAERGLVTLKRNSVRIENFSELRFIAGKFPA